MVQKIAQYQSFVQIGIAVKKKVPNMSTSLSKFAIPLIEPFTAIYLTDKTTLLLNKNSLKLILKLQNFVLFLVGFFFIIVTKYFIKKLYNFRLFFQKFVNPYISIFCLIFRTTNYMPNF